MYTHHAKQRMQQRAINHQSVELVLSYGQEIPSHGGTLYLASAKSCNQMKRDAVPTKQIERVKGVYVVIHDGHVVTVAHRNQPIRAK